MKTKIPLILILLFSLLLFPAYADGLSEAVQALIPENALVDTQHTAGHLQMITLHLDSGEQLEFMWDMQSGKPAAMFTSLAANAVSSVPDQSIAEDVVQLHYPGTNILSSAEDENGLLKLFVIREDFYGYLQVSADTIVSRNLIFGSFVSEGQLTMEGALAALHLHRPQAQLQAIELDMDDGKFIYEGAALLDAEKFEFELDAFTGKLLEWERD